MIFWIPISNSILVPLWCKFAHHELEKFHLFSWSSKFSDCFDWIQIYSSEKKNYIFRHSHKLICIIKGSMTHLQAIQISMKFLLHVASDLTHSERRPQIFIPKRKSTSIVSSNWQHKFLYFHHKSVKLYVLCRHL